MLILLISHENNKCTKSHKNQVCIQITSVVQQDDHGGMKKMKLSSSLFILFIIIKYYATYQDKYIMYMYLYVNPNSTFLLCYFTSTTYIFFIRKIKCF